MSSPIVTPTSMSVEAGSTIVTPARPWAAWMRCLRDRAHLGELDAVVDAERERGVVEGVGRDVVAALPRSAGSDVGEVELALRVVGA